MQESCRFFNSYGLRIWKGHALATGMLKQGGLDDKENYEKSVILGTNACTPRLIRSLH